MRRLPALALSLILAPSDAARAGSDGPVMEVVTLRLAAGVTDRAFLDAAQATEAPLRLQPGFQSRRLTQAADGGWTDLVLRSSHHQALRASEAMMREPAFQPFMAMIDMASVQMRHDTLRLQMD